MYKISMYDNENETWTVEFENVKIILPSQKDAIAFVLQLLKETGRVGY